MVQGLFCCLCTKLPHRSRVANFSTLPVTKLKGAYIICIAWNLLFLLYFQQQSNTIAGSSGNQSKAHFFMMIKFR
jgi:hypothetical protein